MSYILLFFLSQSALALDVQYPGVVPGTAISPSTTTVSGTLNVSGTATFFSSVTMRNIQNEALGLTIQSQLSSGVGATTTLRFLQFSSGTATGAMTFLDTTTFNADALFGFLRASSMSITSGLTLPGSSSMTVLGVGEIGGLAVRGQETITSTLTVQGAADVVGETVRGQETVTSSLTVQGAGDAAGLTVRGQATVTSSQTVQGASDVSGQTVRGQQTVTSSMTVQSVGDVAGLTVRGQETVTSSLTVQGLFDAAAQSSVRGSLTLTNSSLTITGSAITPVAIGPSGSTFTITGSSVGIRTSTPQTALHISSGGITVDGTNSGSTFNSSAIHVASAIVTIDGSGGRIVMPIDGTAAAPNLQLGAAGYGVLGVSNQIRIYANQNAMWTCTTTECGPISGGRLNFSRLADGTLSNLDAFLNSDTTTGYYWPAAATFALVTGGASRIIVNNQGATTLGQHTVTSSQTIQGLFDAAAQSSVRGSLTLTNSSLTITGSAITPVAIGPSGSTFTITASSVGIRTATPVSSLHIATGTLTINGNSAIGALINNQIILSSSTAATVSACGTGPSILGSDAAGKVTVGSAPGSSCTVTFNTAYANAPVCITSNETTANLTRPAPTTTTLVINGTLTGSDVLAYICFGRQ